MERPAGDDRLATLMRTAARRRLDAVLLFDEANVRALTGVACDNCCLALVRAPTASSFSTVFITDFRYVPMVHRVAPGLKTVELARGVSFAAAAQDVCANVDLYSGFVYDMLGIPKDLYTPLFAVARCVSWCAHRMEELVNNGPIIRPAYKPLFHPRDYVKLADR